MKTSNLIATSALSLAVSAAIAAAPQLITVPAHIVYCVTSRALSASAYELPEVRDVLFQTLDKQIEEAALAAGLPSMGVVFVDSVTRGSDLPAGAPQPAATYTVRQCA